MSNPIAIFEDLRETYFRYLDSPFDLRYPDLVQERRRLLDRDGRLYRNPLIEPVPAYHLSGETFRQAVHSLLLATHSQIERDDLSSFVSMGLFPETLPNGHPRQLYSHQREAFEHSVVHGRDIVVTTGTGSGKTECFLLPVVAALIRESATWQVPGVRPSQWDWWNHWSIQGSVRRWAPRVSQRAHENRPAAVRALILYPLNALVEDQLARLRDGLDSAQADAWFQTHRNGNRFYFGRYTGRTPVSGNRATNPTNRLRTELASAERDAQLVAATPELARFFQSLGGSEMWSRWDMQDHPPDILITNYSMLNIMLMRGVEAAIFEETKRWLESDSSHIFHLVVDELHTYRGTPGTEVAYLIRVLLDRIGLTSLNPNAFTNVQANILALQQLRTDLRGTRGVATTTIATAFQNAVGAGPQNPAASADEVLESSLAHIDAADALRLACASGPPQAPILEPRFPEQIAASMFPMLPASQGFEAVEGLLAGLSAARGALGSAPLPVRAHIIFRNLQGLWTCTDPGCTQAPTRNAPTPAGTLHYVPTLTCGCGSRVLELLYCEACGDIFFGGYRRPKVGDQPDPNAGLNPNEWYLSPDHPDLEASPDMASLDRDYVRYAVYWPAAQGLTPASPQWTQDGVGRTWRPARFTPIDGKVALGGRGYLYFVPAMHSANPPNVDSARQAYPARCPRCDADWSRRQIGSPIRTLRTGFQKIAQVLSDALLRNIAAEARMRKLVVFSDSRQDAAKLSAGMRFSHYRDALRQAITEAIAVQGLGAQAFSAQVSGQVLSADQQALAAAFSATNPREAATLSMAASPATAHVISPSHPGVSCQQASQQILARAAHGPFYVAQLAADASSQLLKMGINRVVLVKTYCGPIRARGMGTGVTSTFGDRLDQFRSLRVQHS
jgi:DEAD/DEAH box helicase domain-containing protein